MWHDIVCSFDKEYIISQCGALRSKTSSAATFFSSLTRAVAFPSAVPLHEDTGVHALLPAALFCSVTRTTVVVSAYRHRPVPQCGFQCQSFRP